MVNLVVVCNDDSLLPAVLECDDVAANRIWRGKFTILIMVVGGGVGGVIPAFHAHQFQLRQSYD